MAKLQYRTISKRTIGKLPVGDKEAVYWGPGPARFRCSRLSQRHQGLHRPDTGGRQVQAYHRRSPWRDLAGPGPAQGCPDDRPHQGRRGPEARDRKDADGAHRRRTRRAVSGRACRGSVQTADGRGLPLAGQEIRAARPRRHDDRRGPDANTSPICTTSTGTRPTRRTESSK